MRFVNVTAMLVFGLVISMPVWGDSCSCSSPSGSCSASVSCEFGCWSFCGGDLCEAECVSYKGPRNDPSGLVGLEKGELQSLAASGAPVGQMSARMVTVGMTEGTAADLAFLAGNELGSAISFIPNEANQEVVGLMEQLSVSRIIGLLGQRGGAGLASGGEIHLEANDVSGAHLSDLLSSALGVELEFYPDIPGQRLSLDMKQVPIGVAIRILSEHGRLQLAR